MPASVPVSDVYGTFVDGMMSCITYQVSEGKCGKESTYDVFFFIFFVLCLCF